MWHGAADPVAGGETALGYNVNAMTRERDTHERAKDGAASRRLVGLLRSDSTDREVDELIEAVRTAMRENVIRRSEGQVIGATRERG